MSTMIKRIVARQWLLGILLVLLTCVVYLPALRGGFVWDDDDHLTANPAVAASNGLRLIWSSLQRSRYYPLTLTTFWAGRRLWGLNPLPYHAINVALQALNAVLLWRGLRCLRIRGAWLAAAVWALHPVNVESVAWITELKNTQSGLFFLLSVLCFLRFDENREPRWYALALGCGLAAMLSKPSTVVLPLALLLGTWWRHGKWRRSDIIEIAAFFGLALGMSALTVIEQHRHIVQVGAAEWSLRPAERLVIAGKDVWFYAFKVVWPARLSFVYPRWVIDATSLWSWMPLVALVVVAATLYRYRSHRWARAALFGGGFFVVALLPVLGFFDVFYFWYSFVADHFQYLACMGLISLAVSAGAELCERGGPRGRNLGAFAAAAVLVLLGVTTWKQERIYRDVETLWQDTLAKNPRCWLAHNNLGTILAAHGQTGKAKAEFTEALRLKPDFTYAHENMAKLLELMSGSGRTAKAIPEYEAALQGNPNSVEDHNNLGVALAAEGRFDEAIAQYRSALRISPEASDIHYNVAVALMAEGKVPEAIVEYQTVIRIKPDPATYNNLAFALIQVGRVAEAVEQFRQALVFQPDYAPIHYNLGNALAQLGKRQEAIAEYEQALKLQPNMEEARAALNGLQAGP
jgi:tetratricopeptide (TPR) repeat protein